MPELSLVITVLNEEENIAPLLASVRAALSGLDYEVILVDDGSTDQTKKRILEEADDRTCLVELRKNIGQSNAMMAGIDHSSGSFIALLDGDLQNDPLDIPAMLDLLKQGERDMVAGIRKNRKDGFILRKLPSRMANALIRRMTGVYINDYGCTLKVIRREIIWRIAPVYSGTCPDPGCPYNTSGCTASCTHTWKEQVWHQPEF